VLRILDADWINKVAGTSISEFVSARRQNVQSLGLLIWLVECLPLRHCEITKKPDQGNGEEEQSDNCRAGDCVAKRRSSIDQIDQEK
jgi:hypothetical protein